MKNSLSYFPLAAVCAGLLTACGGGGGSDTPTPTPQPSATTSIKGVVADGYLQGATACLDINQNGRCDSGEPNATSNENGTYEMAGITAGDESKYPILVEVPATAIDKDTGKAVGNPFFLKSPAGKYAFVSPVTTLVQAQIAAGKSEADAVKYVMETLIGISDANVSPYTDYMSMSSSKDYTTVHDAAKVVAGTFQTAYKDLQNEADRLGVQAVLSTYADKTLAFQKSGAKGFAVANGLGTHDDLVSIQRQVAAAGVSVASTQDVNIQFDVVAGTQSVACNSTIALANTVTPVSGQIADLRFYVSNVALINDKGAWVYVTLNANDNQADGVALLDFENGTGLCTKGTAATYTTLSGKVPNGNYVGMAMTLGAPIFSPQFKAGLNHSDTTAASTPALLQIQSMAWNWQGGRKFTKIEFTPDAGTNWPVHIGSTACEGVNPSSGDILFCGNPNRGDYVFASFNSATQKMVLNLDSLFAGSDVTQNKGGSKGCMSSTSDPECPTVFSTLGLDIATGMTSGSQKIFSVRSK